MKTVENLVAELEELMTEINNFDHSDEEMDCMFTKRSDIINELVAHGVDEDGMPFEDEYELMEIQS